MTISKEIFFDSRMLKIFLLGSISGFPWVLIGSCLSLWLKEDGLSRSTIGWAGLIFSVYAINYLWAPIIDRIKIPFLTKKIGHRKSWILSMQILILICLCVWSVLKPSSDLYLIVFIGLVIAISSSTQDITIDALRIEQMEKHETKSIAAAASIAVIGWWTGYKLGGFLALYTAEFFENLGIINYWQLTFLILTILIITCNLLLLSIKENTNNSLKKYHELDKNLQTKFKIFKKFNMIIAFIASTILAPLISFFKKNGILIALSILSFIFLFKIGEAFLGRMSVIFYKEIGFSKSDIGIFSKALGWVTTIIFTLIGGFLTIKTGVYKSLFVAGVFMAFTNLLFALLAWTGKSYLIFTIAVILDDIAAAFATVAFVAFISLLVDRNYTATQYALLASIGTAGRTTLASSSGSLVDWLNGDWSIFFIITTIMVIPSLIILFFIRKKIVF
ncbi:MFS transporter [Alphaproteobacteria bacterium]|nr:MFS transporter [Alphaproteobacteria bacterium]